MTANSAPPNVTSMDGTWIKFMIVPIPPLVAIPVMIIPRQSINPATDATFKCISPSSHPFSLSI